MTPTSKEVDAGADVLLGCLGATALVLTSPFIAALGSIYEAYICTQIWAWFVAPYVPVKIVPLVVFIAADFIVLLLFRSRATEKDGRKMSEVWGNIIGMALFYPSVLWLTAYLIHRWTS